MHSNTRFAAILLLSLFLLGLSAVMRDAAAKPEAPPPFIPRETRIALVIGNANYADEMKLANPVNDAALIGATLKSLGFDVILVTDAPQKQMQRAIVAFGDRLARAGHDAVGLFYYAGHGLQLDGENYLVPTDANISREIDAELEGVPADLVMKQMAYADSRVNIIILDACRNNPLARDFRSVAASQGFAEIRTKPKGTFISYSTAPGEVAVDGANGHSPFAEALAQAMQQPGLDLPEVFQRVRAQVLAATGERQTPWDSSSLVKSFYFIPPADRTGDGPIVAAQPTPVEIASARPQPEPTTVREADANPSVDPAPIFVAMNRSLFAKPGSRLRAEPSTRAPVLAKLPANAELRAVARSKDGAWWQVATRQGEIAFVHADAVTDFRAAKPRSAAPKVVAPQPLPQPTPTLARQSGTGIDVVDQALGWLSSAASGTPAAPNRIRATR